MTTIHTRTGDSGVATITLNRPQLHNAFDETMIAELTEELTRLDAEEEIRVVVLAGEGESFCAGADLDWMRRAADYDRQRNLADAMALGALMKVLHRLSKPTIALVQGPAFGGGAGLVACCDIALATPEAIFAFSEVRLGLIPAVISPYVIEAIGPRAARRYFLSAERFDAAEALRLGLVHEVVERPALRSRGDSLCAQLLRNAPGAMASAKNLVSQVAGRRADDALIEMTAEGIAERRTCPEGREGIAAFLEKRPPAWTRR